MSALRTVVVVVGAAAVGLGFGVGARGFSTPEVRGATAAAVDVAAGRSAIEERCPPVAPLTNTLQGLRARLRAVQIEIDAERIAAVDAEGELLDWPDDLPDAFDEMAVEAALLAAQAAVGAGKLITLDCGEYPCVAAVAFAPDENGEFANRAFRDALIDEGYTPWGTEAWRQDTEDEPGVKVSIIALPGPDLQADGARFTDRRAARRYEDMIRGIWPVIVENESSL